MTSTVVAGNAYLADVIAPLQSLSRRFWLHHVRDEEWEIRHGSHLLTQTLEGVLDSDADASIGLNDYLVQFTRDVISAGAAQPHRKASKVQPANP